MNKNELIEDISDRTGFTEKDTLAFMDAYHDAVQSTLTKGEDIHIRGFGSFIVKKRARKVARNINRNRAIIIPEHFIPAFRPSREFVRKVKSRVRK